MKGVKPTWYAYIRSGKGLWERYRDRGYLYDRENVPRKTKSIAEKSRGTESITEKSRGRGSAKCGKGCRAKQGFFRTCTGTKRPFNIQNGQDEMAKKKRGQLSETSSQVEQDWGHGQR